MAIDAEYYRKKVQHARIIFLQHQQENTMNPVFSSPKTSLAGVVAAAPLFVLGIGALIGGDIGGGVGNILAAIGVLFGLLQAQDASKVADVVKQIVPKPQPQAPTE